MRVGDRLVKDGKTIEITSIINETNYGFKVVSDEAAKEPVFDPGISFEEEVEQAEKKVKRGRKKG